jgi:hypothetical protein
MQPTEKLLRKEDEAERREKREKAMEKIIKSKIYIRFSFSLTLILTKLSYQICGGRRQEFSVS